MQIVSEWSTCHHEHLYSFNHIMLFSFPPHNTKNLTYQNLQLRRDWVTLSKAPKGLKEIEAFTININ